MGRKFAVSDLHGQYDLFKQIKEFMTEDDICYVLGDVIDRGTGSIKILLEIMTDKRFKMLKGNHEDMMIQAIQDAEEGYMDFQLWYMNGGRDTHEELITYRDDVQHAVVQFIKGLPLVGYYKDVVLSHAGFDWSLGDDVDEETLLWDRSHITSSATSKEGKIQVHGHTPVPDVKKGAKDVIKYAADKYCIDIGACFTGRTALLDLDTFEAHYFEREV